MTATPSTLQKRIFITGASGCIGHYIVEAIAKNPNYHLDLLLRTPSKLNEKLANLPNVHIHQGDLRDNRRYKDLLQQANVAIPIATCWGGSDAFDINVVKNIELINSLNPDCCEQVLYFSTASILGNDNQPLKEAGQIGTDYVRSKYDCATRLPKLDMASKITALYPTFVLGGDDEKPRSHLTGGLPDIMRYIKLIRHLKADASFHFIHAYDIAQVVAHLVDNPPSEPGPRHFVLGGEPTFLNDLITTATDYLSCSTRFKIPLSNTLTNVIINVFNIQLAAWDRFCMNYRHFTYTNAVNPATFDLTPYCQTFEDVLEQSGISAK
ncbi:MAG: NAD-dependent epimerase/dehydratase family protein [Cyanophyceae cyanobacterium]